MRTSLQSRPIFASLLLATLLSFTFAPASGGAPPLDELTKSTTARALGEMVLGEDLAVVFRDPPTNSAPAARAQIVNVDVPGSTELLLRAFAEDPSLVQRASAETRITFTVREPTPISMLLSSRRGTFSLSLDSERIEIRRFFSTTVEAGTHTVAFAATNSRSVSEHVLRLRIAGKAPDPDDFRWKDYADGAWETAGNWKAGKVPVEGDVAIFDLLPARGARSVPLPFLGVSSGPRTVSGLEISRSAVALQGFNLALAGTGDIPDALLISNGGVLFVNAAAGGPRVDFTTAGAAIGEGQKAPLGGGEFLEECQLTIAPGAVWKNTGNLGIGERMDGAVVIQTRLSDGTPSESREDVFLGVQPGAGGSLSVSGRFATGGLLAATRKNTRSILFVDQGGLLTSSFAQGGSGPGGSLRGFIDDAPNPDAGYTSRGERSTWQIRGLLSLAGELGSAPGKSGGGFALVNVLDGGLLTAAAATVGEGEASSKPVPGRSAILSVTGFDPNDEQPSEARIAGELQIGVGCSGVVRAESGGLVSARSIHVKTLGRLECVGIAADPGGSSSITAETGEPGDISLRVDGGGRVLLAQGADITAGDLLLGGATDERVARFRHDSADAQFARGTLRLRSFSIGDGLGFPGRFDLLDGLMSIRENSLINQNSIFAGFGSIAVGIGAAPEVTLRNDGRMIVPPGAGRVLEFRGSFRQSGTGELLLTVNKKNDASLAPLKVRGAALALAGKVTLQFSGGRTPRQGEVFALINAENAVIANLADIRVAGSRRAFEVVENDSGIAVMFR